jgi:hypothetical protein
MCAKLNRSDGRDGLERELERKDGTLATRLRALIQKVLSATLVGA